ncbi:hypothetical protein SISNIDRAFT_391451, partial [Sistotremastrum niveocremeum HHB9708]
LDGKTQRLVEFHRVLHVPDLCSNLLAVLHLTRHKRFQVTIRDSQMSFLLHNKRLFTATVKDSNNAVLDGITNPMTDFAGLVSTCPLHYTLWHRRCAHANHDDIKRMHTQSLLVTGITVKDNTLPDPICEPCLAGKMSRLVPKTASRQTEAFGLIHSDLHQQKKPTPQGYHYWVTFIDD